MACSSTKQEITRVTFKDSSDVDRDFLLCLRDTFAALELQEDLINPFVKLNVKLLISIGKEMDKRNGTKCKMDNYFQKLEYLAKNDGVVGDRIKNMIMDLIDLRNNQWVPRPLLDRKLNNMNLASDTQQKNKSIEKKDQVRVPLNLSNEPLKKVNYLESIDSTVENLISEYLNAPEEDRSYLHIEEVRPMNSARLENLFLSGSFGNVPFQILIGRLILSCFNENLINLEMIKEGLKGALVSECNYEGLSRILFPFFNRKISVQISQNTFLVESDSFDLIEILHKNSKEMVYDFVNENIFNRKTDLSSKSNSFNKTLDKNVFLSENNLEWINEILA